MLATAGFLLLAGVVAGAVGSAGGITSLVSYPALLAVGVPALPANATNLVAGAACWPGAALTSRREMAGAGSYLRRGLPVAALGAAVGAVLLLVTPAGAFAVIVPYLVAAGSVALLAQPVLTRAVRGRRGHALLPIGLIAVYGGYFGAARGSSRSRWRWSSSTPTCRGRTRSRTCWSARRRWRRAWCSRSPDRSRGRSSSRSRAGCSRGASSARSWRGACPRRSYA
jgi:hypothetical protein